MKSRFEISLIKEIEAKLNTGQDEQLELIGIPAPTCACKRCGAVFARLKSSAPGRRPEYCGVECASAAAAEQRARWAEEHAPRADPTGVCPSCGVRFSRPPSGGRRGLYCSEECRRTAIRRRDAGKRARARRVPGPAVAPTKPPVEIPSTGVEKNDDLRIVGEPPKSHLLKRRTISGRMGSLQNAIATTLEVRPCATSR